MTTETLNDVPNLTHAAVSALAARLARDLDDTLMRAVQVMVRHVDEACAPLDVNEVARRMTRRQQGAWEVFEFDGAPLARVGPVTLTVTGDLPSLKINVDRKIEVLR
ncbi:MAG: hypothetical protein KA761_00055 [Gemmatimonadaceae bacterium]|nr:hypothetical protein [Gemmatimonadaceae bacterium]